MTFAGAAFVEQHHVVVFGVAGFNDQLRELGRGFTWSAGHVEDRAVLWVRVFCRDNNDLQREHAPFFGFSVFEHFVETAAHFLFHARDVTRPQDYTP